MTGLICIAALVLLDILMPHVQVLILGQSVMYQDKQDAKLQMLFVRVVPEYVCAVLITLMTMDKTVVEIVTT